MTPRDHIQIDPFYPLIQYTYTMEQLTSDPDPPLFIKTTYHRSDHINYSIKLFHAGKSNSQYWVKILLMTRKTNPAFGLLGACLGQAFDLAEYIIDLHFRGWKHNHTGPFTFIQSRAKGWAFMCACLSGDQTLINKMIAIRACDRNMGLLGACRAGNRELAERMIGKGATRFDLGLLGAHLGGHQDLVQWMIDLGAKTDILNKDLKHVLFVKYFIPSKWITEFGFENLINILK